MKKFILLTFCVIMALSFVACNNEKTLVDEDSVQIQNPFVDCESIEEAENLVGFGISIPEEILEGYVQTSISVIENELVEVNFEDSENQICFRKAKGQEDISGDYNKYKEVELLEINEKNVNLKGNDGKVNVATWTDEDYSYAICSNADGDGIDSNAIIDIIKNIQ